MPLVSLFIKKRFIVILGFGIILLLSGSFIFIKLKSKPHEYSDKIVTINKISGQYFVVKIKEVKNIGIVDVYYKNNDGKHELIFSEIKRSLYYRNLGVQTSSVDFFVYPFVNKEKKVIVDGVVFQTHVMSIPENSEGMIDFDAFNEYLKKNNLQKITPW